MVKRIPVALASVLWSVLALQPAAAQPAQARGAAPGDLEARFQQAQAEPDLGRTLLKTGRKVAAVCANCHGEGGNSVKPEIPNLAGQNPSYLLDQLRQFAEGRRRNEFMEGMIKAMSTDEKVGMVLFYASQKVEHRPASNPALAARGQAYYSKTCFRCHGDDGMGNQELARIAGQQPVYLSTTLKRYRTGSGPRVNALMAGETRRLTDADIEALVAYVSSMK